MNGDNLSAVISYTRAILGDNLKTDGHDVHSFETSYRFSISEDFPVEDSIVVKRNGETVDEEDISYDSDTNEVILDLESSEEFDLNDSIEIYYDYYQKYSDTEIRNWVKASLIYFTIHNAPKEFEMTESSGPVYEIELIDEDDEAIETSDLYAISIITSILIDPKNVNIKTPDFTISAIENKSQSEQIAEIFTRWLEFLGSIEFILDEGE